MSDSRNIMDELSQGEGIDINELIDSLNKAKSDGFERVSIRYNVAGYEEHAVLKAFKSN